MDGLTEYTEKYPDQAARLIVAIKAVETTKAAFFSSNFGAAELERFESAEWYLIDQRKVFDEFVASLPRNRYIVFQTTRSGQPTGRDMIVRAISPSHAAQMVECETHYENSVVHAIGEIETWIAAWQRLTYRTGNFWKFR